MKTYIINLDKDIDRLQVLSNQLHSFGIEFERIPAIYGKEYEGNEYNEDEAIKQNGRALSFGELGCALSHKRAYEAFLKTDDDYALILEDDVVFTQNIKKIIKQEIKKNKNRKGETFWDYLQCDYPEPGLFLLMIWIRELYRTVLLQKNIYRKILLSTRMFTRFPFLVLLSVFESIRNYVYKGAVSSYRDVYLAGAYVITREGARTLVDSLGTVVYPADKVNNELRKRNLLKVSQYCPLIVYQNRDTFVSNIGPDMKV